jgi:CubicO group peptidase (beta-lactamase class C family)
MRLRVFLLCSLVLGAVPPAAGWEDADSRSYEEAITTGRAALQRMVDRGVPGASIAVVADGELIWEEGFGWADLEHCVPAKADTRFGIGSITKTLTTALFARLAERGTVGWDIPVEQYLPTFPYAGRKITPRLIASHLSGLDDSFSSSRSYSTERFSTQQALEHIFAEPLRHEPGSRLFYATGSYTILAAILEKATGEDFRSLMRRELLDPLRLRSTVPNERPAIVEHRASFYERDESGEVVNALSYDPSYKWAGAGYVSTAADLARFASALLSGEVLGEEATRQLFSPMQLTSGEYPVTGMGSFMGAEDSGIGLGWNIARDWKGRLVYHQPGGGVGISAWLLIYPDEKLTIAILSNLTAAPVGGKTLHSTVDAFLAAKQTYPKP